MYSEDDLLPISALQHLLFCERQCALIHVEGLWSENRYTAEGRLMHARIDAGGSVVKGDVRIAFSLALRSLRLGLAGKADVVEFHREKRGGGTLSSGAIHWRPFPVEHKRGRPKKAAWDKVQLCAQAICLEEMLAIEVPKGALFYGKPRRRVDVLFDTALRSITEGAAGRLHELIREGRTPPPVFSPACDQCSFVDICLPAKLEQPRPVHRYFQEVLKSG